MRILAVSDLHGYLPELPPPGPAKTLLIVAGDVSPIRYDREPWRVMHWLDGEFRQWLIDAYSNGVNHIVGIAGNHDFAFEYKFALDELHLPWDYLLDSQTSWEGLNIYGLPWVPNLRGWAYYGDSDALARRFGAIPDGIDIIVSHGPPQGYGDGGHPDWCTSAANDAIERVWPKAFVCGHIHEGYGTYRLGGTDVYNVSFVDEDYNAMDRITEVRVDD